MDIRCPHRKFGVILGTATGQLEVSCPSRWCGHDKDVVVLHVFDLATGQITKTSQYREPRKE